MRQGGHLQVYLVHCGRIVDLHNRADGRSWRWTSTRPFAAFLASAINYRMASSARAIPLCTRGSCAREIYVLCVGLCWTQQSQSLTAVYARRRLFCFFALFLLISCIVGSLSR